MKKEIKKTKPTKTTITTATGDSFSVTPRDFIYFLAESLSELYEQKDVSDAYYQEQREILFETYFAFKYLAREFNWETPKEIENLRVWIDKYFNEYCQKTIYN